MTKDSSKIVSCQPAFRIGSYAEAVAHYVDWLGFNLDWEWRSEPDAPVIVSVSRDNLSLFLNEQEAASNVWLRVSVVGLQGMVDEWNERRPDSIELILEQPYELPTAYVADPFGNGLAFQELQTEQIKLEHDLQVERAAAFLEQHHDKRLLSSEALAGECGCTLGVAGEAIAIFVARSQQG